MEHDKLTFEGVTIPELARLYRQAVATRDRNLVGVAEAAAFRVASAEASLMQAHALRRFVASAGE